MSELQPYSSFYVTSLSEIQKHNTIISENKRVVPFGIEIPGYQIIKILGAGAFGTVAHIRRFDTGKDYLA